MKDNKVKTYEPEKTPGFLPTITAYQRNPSSAVMVGSELTAVMN
jgi:hypothetical protein